MSSDFKYDIVVIGCGVFGLSSALELNSRGYKVLALDRRPVPSEYSAGNDLNKILRVEYSDDSTAALAAEAIELWQSSELYRPSFVKTGRLTLSPQDSKSNRSEYERNSLTVLQRLGVKQCIVALNSREQVGAAIPAFKYNNLPDNFDSSYNRDCGTGLSSRALRNVYERAEKSGVTFLTGDEGNVIRIGSNNVEVKSGHIYKARKVLVTAGASTDFILPLDNQIKVFGSFVVHIQLNEEEYDKYKDIPIFFSAEHGYFFPPDEETHRIKIGVTSCDAYSEIDHPFETGKKLRAPRYTTDHPDETFPKEHTEDIKNLLHLVVPELENHGLVDLKTCWISDSCDSHFLIDESPQMKDVYVATGDSGHGFKFLPNIGKYITQCIEGTLDDKLAQMWKWKDNPSFSSGKNAKSRSPRPHYDLESTVFVPQG